MATLEVLCLVYLMFCVTFVNSDAFSEGDIIKNYTNDVETNDGQVDKSQNKDIFKLRKYNDIWSRAMRNKIQDTKLERLKDVLVKLDQTELDLKHMNREDKQVEQAIKEHLDEVLKEFGLLDKEEPLLDHHDVHFNDERINQLWQDAVDGGHFRDDELHSLHKEMRHMEGNVNEVHSLRQETQRLRKSVGDNMENDIRVADNHVEAQEVTDMKELDAMNSRLDDTKTRVTEQVKYIEKKIRNKENAKKSEFSDNRVNRLWEAVQKANFTVDELDAVKGELQHFQIHIDKLRYWERHGAELAKREVSAEATDDLANELLETQEKVDNYKRKVKKYHVTMTKQMKRLKIEL